MSTLMQIGLANAVCAALLGILALVVSRYCRRPAILHSLWLLVLLKLVIPAPFPFTVAHLPEELASLIETAPQPGTSEYTPLPEPSPAPAASITSMDRQEGRFSHARVEVKQNQEKAEPGSDQDNKPAPSSDQFVFYGTMDVLSPTHWNVAPAAVLSPLHLEFCVRLLGGVWLAGIIVWFAWATVHIGRFQHLLRHAHPAGEDIQNQARQLAQQMGLTKCPKIYLLPGPLPPLVWAAVGRVSVFFPAKLLERLDPTERASLLVHELAHIYRRDHWVRWLELAAASLFWWYPLVWLSRRRLHIHEEECCDAWVVGEVSARAYASAILSTLDFLAEDRAPLPVMASGLAGVEMLKRRLSLIMGGGTPKRLSSLSKFVILLGCSLLLPLRPNLAQTEKKASPHPESPVAKAESASFDEEPTVFNPQSSNPLDSNKALKIGNGVIHKEIVTLLRNHAQGERLPLASLQQTHLSLRAHADVVWTVAFSPDSRTLASVGGLDRGGELKLWEVDTGKARVAFTEAKVIRCAAFSPDGRILATSSGEQIVQLRKAPTGRISRILKGHRGGVNALIFSPDGRSLLTGSPDKTAKLWDLATGKDLTTFIGHQDRVLSVAFAPDGKTIATASKDHTARLWNAADGKLRLTLKGHTEGIEAVTFSPDGKTVATGSWDQTVRLWDVATGQMKNRLLGQNCKFLSVAFAPDGKTLATAGGYFQNDIPGEVRLWDVATARLLRVLPGHTSRISCVRFAPDGQSLASIGDDGIVKLWSVRSLPHASGARLKKAP